MTVFATARRESRILLTLDKDFGELFDKSPSSEPAGVVLFRLPRSSGSEMSNKIVAILEAREDWAGAFGVAEIGRIRMRRIG